MTCDDVYVFWWAIGLQYLGPSSFLQKVQGLRITMVKYVYILFRLCQRRTQFQSIGFQSHQYLQGRELPPEQPCLISITMRSSSVEREPLPLDWCAFSSRGAGAQASHRIHASRPITDQPISGRSAHHWRVTRSSMDSRPKKAHVVYP
jgi:hypothetical protein